MKLALSSFEPFKKKLSPTLAYKEANEHHETEELLRGRNFKAAAHLPPCL